MCGSVIGVDIDCVGIQRGEGQTDSATSRVPYAIWN